MYFMNLLDEYLIFNLTNEHHRLYYRNDMQQGYADLNPITYDIEIITNEWIIKDDDTFTILFSAYIVVSWILAVDDIYSIIIS